MNLRKRAAMTAVASILGITASGMTGQALLADDSYRAGHHSQTYPNWHLRVRNFYSDWGSVLRVPGNGTYVYSNGSTRPIPEPFVVEAPVQKVKIIDVATEQNACTYEYGICVIRGN